MGREKRKTRLNKGEATEFIGFGAFTAASPAAAPAAETSPTAATTAVAPSTPKGLSLAPVYLGSESQLSLLFPRIGQKRDAITNTKALQELRDFFRNDQAAIPKKSQVDALAHFLYLYQSKLHYDNTPRVRAASLECCQQALIRVPKAFTTLVSNSSQQQTTELLGMMLCERADPAADVRKAAHQLAEALEDGLDVDKIDTTTTTTASALIDKSIWEYVQRILSYGKPLVMHQALFQKKSQQQQQQQDSNKLSEKQQEEVDEKFVRIVGTALGGLQIHLQQQHAISRQAGLSSSSSSSSPAVPSLPNAEDVRYLWKTLASPTATLRRKTYTLLSTCCQQAPSLVDPTKLSNILTQNLSAEKEPTNVKILLETLLAFVASVPPEGRTALLGQYTKALTKLFSKGCHGATQWAPTVLPIVALLPTEAQPAVLTSIWQGKSNLVGTADQLEVVAAVAETATFLLLKQSHELAEVLAKCWLQALKVFVTRSIGSSSSNNSSNSGPIPRAYDHLGQILAKDLQLLDTAQATKPNSAMILLDDWFWNTEIPKVLASDDDSAVELTQLANLVQRFPASQATTTTTTDSDGDSHLPKIWKQLFHHYLQQCQASAGLVPGQDIYELWMILLERISIDELFIDVDMKAFLMNDLLRWMVIHTSSLSDQFSDQLAKYDFQVYQKCRNSQGGAGTWDTILRELVAAKSDLEALVSGLLILTTEAGLDSVRSTILDDLCRQVAKESIIELHGEDSEDELSHATELHLHYHQKASDLLQTCVGLGEIDGVLVDGSVVSHWIDLACPEDPSTTRGSNPVLETLVSLVKNDYFKDDTSSVERTLIQAWRQGGDLWRETVIPWISKNNTTRASVIKSASTELQSTVRQASSEAGVDADLSYQWAERAVRLLELCQNTKDPSNEIPLPSLDIVGLAEPRLWDFKNFTPKSFASLSLMYVMELLDDQEGDVCEYRWSLFANTTSADQDQLLIMILYHLSNGTKDLLLSHGARRRLDDSAILLNKLGGQSVSPEHSDRWLGSSLSFFSSILSEGDEELVCRGVSVVSQLVSIGFSSVRPAEDSGTEDKLKTDQIGEGDSVWYIPDAENPKLREPCTIVKVHNGLPSEIYFTIRVERDGKIQERQTVCERLRSSAESSTSNGRTDGVLFVNELDRAEIKRRQKTSAFVIDNLVLPSWDNFQLHEYEIVNVLISQLGLLGPRGIGSLHYTVFQKLLAAQSTLVGNLDAASTPKDFPASALWSLAFALGFGCNTPVSSWNASLIGFDPEATVDALLRLLYDELSAIKSPSLEVMRPTIAMLTVSLPVLQHSDKFENAKSLVYLFVEKSLKEATKKGNGFDQDDYVALRAIDVAQDDHEVTTEPNAMVEMVGSFASRWESSPSPEWANFSLCTSVLEMILTKKPRLAGMAGRKHGDSLAAALYVENKRWLALRFLEAYAQQKKPIHDSPDSAMNKVTAKRLKAWSKVLVPEEAEELEEDIGIACQFIPKGLMNDVESWQEETQKDFHVNENDAFGRLTSWLAYLRIADTAGGMDSLNRTALNSYTRQCGAVTSIMDLAIMYANVSTNRKVKLAKVDNVDTLVSNGGNLELSKLASAVIFRTVEVFPTLSKNWWEMSCPNYFRDPVREFVESNISPELLRRELQKIKGVSSFGEMTVKGSLISREVTALYSQDEFTLSVVIKLPLSFPFRRAEVDCSKTLGVPESRWKRWTLQITQMLNNQGGSLTDALLLWKENVDKEFEGIDPCPVCYSVLHVKTHKLPEMQCKTCQNRFHFDCLTQWFRSSGKSACVICQQPWAGTRV
jgi:hypothetical protein